MNLYRANSFNLALGLSIKFTLTRTVLSMSMLINPTKQPAVPQNGFGFKALFIET
jgi:hypothetical protein